jgi:hypothetical protein
MYILLELIEGEPKQLQVFPASDAAIAYTKFDEIVMEYARHRESFLQEQYDLENEIAGTERMAGDDVHSVTLYWKPI